MINSRRGWPDLLSCTGHELLSAAGYKQSRYSAEILKRFRDEAKAARLIDYDVTSKVTVYYIEDLTREMVDAAKRAVLSRTPKKVNELSPRLAARLAKEAEKMSSDADSGAGNIGKEVKNSNGFGGDKKEGGGVVGAADADAISRELAELGL